ncbi:MAG: glycosyltransferase family 4 protein [Magnetococcales bacterium]|nr:glycosyltransferase family 4 protein [Magnetococcales bacterium]
MIATLAKEWTAKGERVSLFVPGSWSDDSWLEESHGQVTVYKKRLRIPSYPHRSLRGFVGGVLEFPLTLLQLRKFCKKEAVDLIHLHTPRDYQVYFRLLRWFGGPPMVLTFHGTDALIYADGSHPGMGLISWIVKGMDHLTSVSRDYAQRLAHCPNGRETIHYIPNGIDLTPPARVEPTAATQALFNLLPEKFFIIVGWIEPPKGCDLAVRAWALLQRKNPDIHLLFIGDQAYKKPGEPFWPGYLESIKALVAELGCQQQVHFAGTQSPEVVRDLMERAYGLIFPSLQEGLPYVLLEAGAVAMPVVCNDIPAFTEIIDPGKNGLIAANGDEESLANAVESLVLKPEWAKELGQGLLQTVKEKYSSQIMAQGYLDLFNSVVEEGE